jgi:hypothetical protein
VLRAIFVERFPRDHHTSGHRLVYEEEESDRKESDRVVTNSSIECVG